MHNMIHIPGGLVSIGSPERHLDVLPELQHFDRAWFEDEAPQHDRTIHTFWIDAHPVTNAQFAEFVAATNYVTAAEQRGYGLVYGLRYWQKESGACWRRPGGATDSIAQRPDHPVVHVDHDDAASYARWAGTRLPTEAEWGNTPPTAHGGRAGPGVTPGRPTGPTPPNTGRAELSGTPATGEPGGSSTIASIRLVLPPLR